MKTKQLSIKRYALSFILLYVLVFIISSIIAFLDVQKLYNSGKTELVHAIKTLVNNNKIITDKFALWDEVHQQINNPEYYTYWQTHRLYSSNILPDFFIGASIYNESGKTLGQISTSSLPEQIINNSIEPYFQIENHKPFLITISKIIDQDDQQKILG